jgi:hypothetical protein
MRADPFDAALVRPDDVREASWQVAMVVVGAAAPFAPTSYARARLLRQLHASGLLSAAILRRGGPDAPGRG